MANLFSQLLSDHKGGNLLIKGSILDGGRSGRHNHRLSGDNQVVRLLGVRWNSFPAYLLDEDHDILVDPVYDTQTTWLNRTAALENPQAPREDLTKEFNVVDVLLYEGESRERRILLHVHSSDVELL